MSFQLLEKRKKASRIAGRTAQQKRLNTVVDVIGHTEAVLVDEEVEKLITERREARARRDFARSDEIRDRLAERGILLEDGPAGTRWRRK